VNFCRRDKSIDVVVSIEEIVDPELKVQENELRSLEEAMLQLAVNESTLMSQDPSLGGSQSSSTTYITVVLVRQRYFAKPFFPSQIVASH
jgi:hypothetical protein